jgi:Ribonuclease G/E
LEPGRDVEIEHVKPEGKVILLRGGRIASLSEDKSEMLIRRFLKGGKYDGLGVIIEKGDYAMTGVTEGDWVVKHSYFSAEGVLKGEYWNINTPVEFYPDRIRYIDLHVDVVARKGGSRELIDKDQLDHLVEARYITADIAQRALQTAETIISPHLGA